jgi:hypothetical protein
LRGDDLSPELWVCVHRSYVIHVVRDAGCCVETMGDSQTNDVLARGSRQNSRLGRIIVPGVAVLSALEQDTVTSATHELSLDCRALCYGQAHGKCYGAADPVAASGRICFWWLNTTSGRQYWQPPPSMLRYPLHHDSGWGAYVPQGMDAFHTYRYHNDASTFRRIFVFHHRALRMNMPLQNTQPAQARPISPVISPRY